jgi:5'-nucleotidase
MRRRDFLKNAAVVGGGLTAVGSGSALWLRDHGAMKITILHTNDVHSRIDPFPDTDPRYPGLGGFARRAAIIKRIRQEEEHVLLFDSGDIFQGTPYFNYYGGELEFRLMSEMGYDAATLGNHDFDNGIEGLLKQMPHAKFPFINTNYDLTKTDLQGRVLPFEIFERGGVKVGVFGLGIELNGLVNPRMFGNVTYRDPLPIYNDTAKMLRNEMGCHLVICLSHLGYRYDTMKISDTMLAQTGSNVDIILGGHTHTLLEQPDVQQDSQGREVIICQTGWAGVHLGRLDITIDPLTKLFRPAYIALKVLKSQ